MALSYIFRTLAVLSLFNLPSTTAAQFHSTVWARRNVTTSSLPYISTSPTPQLYVNGEPFLMRAGELQNSSPSSARYMADVWSNLTAANLNTVLAAVTWQMVEPTEGEFDFAEMDGLVQGARDHGLHLVLLWFGSFKSASSNYAPRWVKTNPERFPRAVVNGTVGPLSNLDTLSTFSENLVEADEKAFGTMMGHLREIDEQDQTVLMVQVENEPGLSGDSRDRSDQALTAFDSPVPEDLLRFLDEEFDSLSAPMRDALSANTTWTRGSSPENSSWGSVFGTGIYTDELFMAYAYARFIGRVAAAGKKAYPIPLFANVWLSFDYDGFDMPDGVVAGGAEPGVYPSGGGVPRVLDIWQHFTPLDAICPDIYFNAYDAALESYNHRNNPIFIPEQRRDDFGFRRIWSAIGTHGAMGASPFGIDTLTPEESPATVHYGLMKKVEKILLKAQQTPERMHGFFLDTPDELGASDVNSTSVQLGVFNVTITRARNSGAPQPGAGIIIQTEESLNKQGRFLLIGWGFEVQFVSQDPTATYTGLLNFEEKEIVPETGVLTTLRILNGDETSHGTVARMPNLVVDTSGFDIVPVLIGSGTAIAEVTVYYI